MTHRSHIAGVVVRMPATWRMGRPSRPQVAGTIGGKSPSVLGKDALLDFRVELTIDGEPLTPAEVQLLLASANGLTLLHGRWVEVDRERIASWLQALPGSGAACKRRRPLLCGGHAYACGCEHRRRRGIRRSRSRLVERHRWALARRGAPWAVLLRGGSRRSIREGSQGSSGPISRSVSAGYICFRGSASVHAWPMTWGSARPSRCSPCYWCSVAMAGRGFRACWSRLPPCSPTGPRKLTGSHPVSKLRSPIPQCCPPRRSPIDRRCSRRRTQHHELWLPSANPLAPIDPVAVRHPR